MGQFFGCIRCRVRRQRVQSRLCGPCSRGEPVPEAMRQRRHVRGSVHNGNLIGPPMPKAGAMGTKCRTCGARLEFGVTEGQTWEWCPEHGARYIPREIRVSRLHDQRDILEARLAEEVTGEMERVNERFKHLQGAGRKMRPLDLGWK